MISFICMVKKKQAMCYVNIIDKEKVCESDEYVYGYDNKTVEA